MSDGALSIASQAVVGTRRRPRATSAPRRRTAATSRRRSSSRSTQLIGRPVGRPDGAQPERRPGHLPRDLLLEQRQPAAAALQAQRRQLDPARQHLQQRAAARRHEAQLSALGSTISFLQDGVTRITVTDTSITGGAPGIMTYGPARPTTGPAAPPPLRRHHLLGRRQCLGSPGRSCCRTTAVMTSASAPTAPSPSRPSCRPAPPTPSPSRPTQPARPAGSPTAPARSARRTSPTWPSPAPTRRQRGCSSSTPAPTRTASRPTTSRPPTTATARRR